MESITNVVLVKNVMPPNPIQLLANILSAAPLTVQQLQRIQNANVVLSPAEVRVTLVLVSKECQPTMYM